MPSMKTIRFPGSSATYEVTDAQARTSIAAVQAQVNEMVDGTLSVAGKAADAAATKASLQAVGERADAAFAEARSVGTAYEKSFPLTFGQLMKAYDWPYEKVGTRLGTGIALVPSPSFETVEQSIPAPLRDFMLFGMCVQTGTPTPSAPVPITLAGSSGSIGIVTAAQENDPDAVTVSIPTPGGMGAIPVPFGGNNSGFIRDYKADVIDWAERKLIRWVSYKRVYAKAISGSGYISIDDVADSAAAADAGYNLYCTHYVSTDKMSIGSAPEGSIRYAQSGSALYVKDTEHATDLATAQQFFNENEVYVAYMLKEPVITDLTDAQIEALSALRSPDGEGVMYSTDTANPEMYVQYYLSIDTLDKSAEIEELQSSIEEMQGAHDSLKAYVRGMSPMAAVTGAIASVDDAAPLSVEGLTFAVEPVQDLHGYDKPWPAGGGKNLMPCVRTDKTVNGVTFKWNDDGTLVTSGTANASIRYDIFNGNPITLMPGTYIIWGLNDTTVNANGASIQLRKVISSSDTSSIVVKVGGTDSPKTFTVDEQVVVYPVAFISAASLSKAANFTWYPMLCLASETDTAFTPYSNVCPVSGWTGATITRLGKNLWPDVYNPAPVSSLRRKHVFVGNNTVTLSTSMPKNNNNACNLFLLAGQATTGENSNTNGVDVNISRTVTAVDGYVTVSYRNVDGVDPTDYDTQLEFGDTVTSFEPYQTPNEYSVTFPSSVGTVYGGTLDVTTGVLTVDRAIVDLGTLNWQVFSASPHDRFGTDGLQGLAVIPPTDSTLADILCSAYPIDTATHVYNHVVAGSVALGANSRLYCYDPNYSTSADFKAAMSGVQLCYRLVSPITYTLTPQEITMLKGVNNLWANTGDVSLQYRQDIYTALSNKIAELQALHENS